MRILVLIHPFLVLLSDPGPLREAAEQKCLVWDLVVALWGKLKENQQDEEGKAIQRPCPKP